MLRFFGERPDPDLPRLAALKRAFEERIEAEAGRIKTLEDFRQFVATRANQLKNRPLPEIDPLIQVVSPAVKLPGS